MNPFVYLFLPQSKAPHPKKNITITSLLISPVGGGGRNH